MNKEPDKDLELQETLHTSLDVYEEALQTNGGPYLMGEDFTLADVHLLPFFSRLVVSLRHFKDYAVPPGRFSRLLAWYLACMARPSVQTVSPSDERIVEVYQKFVQQDYSFDGLNTNKR